MAKFQPTSIVVGKRFVIFCTIVSLLLVPIYTRILPHREPTYSSNLNQNNLSKSRSLRLPAAYNNPGQAVEQWVSDMGRSMRSMRRLPAYTTKLFGDKINSMARTGRRINNGIVITGRSVTNMLRDLFS